MTDFNVLYLLYRLIFLSAFMILLIEWRYSFKVTMIVFISTILFFWGICAYIYSLTDIVFFNAVFPFFISLPILLCFMSISKSDPFKVIFSFLTVSNFGMLTSYAGFLALYYTQSQFLRIIAELVAVISIFILVLTVFRKPYFKMMATLNKGWELLYTVPAILSFIIYLLLYVPSEIIYWPEKFTVTTLVFILLFLFYAVFFVNFENINQFFQLKMDKEFMILQAKLQKMEYTSIIDKMEDAKILRHDMKHHLNIIITLLNDKNFAETKTYIHTLEHNLSDTIVESFCDNYAINVILSSLVSKARNENITVECSVSLSEEINIDTIDLGIIISNAISNAINACVKIEDVNHRFLSIEAKEHFNQLYIQIINSYVGEVKFDGEFPVTEEIGHGLGTRSVAYVAEKYNGVFSFIAEECRFKTTVVLDNL